jgi:hypothetical protein
LTSFFFLYRLRILKRQGSQLILNKNGVYDMFRAILEERKTDFKNIN